MTVRFSRGFTIIELVLVVAISGLIAAVLLGGWSVGVATQEYKDSVRSLASKIQQQYTNTTSVINDRNSLYTCALVSGNVSLQTVSPPAAGSSRGATDCVLMGRYIVINGSNVTANNIIGIEPAALPPAPATEATVIKSYRPTRVDNATIADEKYNIAWGVRPYASNTNTATMHLAVLLVRSPATGVVYTYSLPITAADPAPDTLIDSGSTGERIICMDPNATVAQERLAVVIGQNASSVSSISVRSASSPLGNNC